MGGQACVYYGALQISKDVDFLVDSDNENLARLSDALRELKAERIAVPSFSKEYLEKGHSIHFRCKIPEAKDLRVDVMSKLRAMPDFETLYDRREEVQLSTGEKVAIMGRLDLIQAKKTQRDKDWPVISRLAELHYLQHRQQPTADRLQFWFSELRSEEPLLELAKEFPSEANAFSAKRKLIDLAIRNDRLALSRALAEEVILIKELDREFWKPLKAELEQMRHQERNLAR